MPRHRRPLSELLTVGAFTTAEARSAGIDPRRLSAPEATRLSRGVYASLRGDVTEHEIVRAYQRSTPDAVACRNTAARLLGLPLPLGTLDWSLENRRFLVHLSYGSTHRHSSGRLRWSQLDLGPEEIITEDGVRVTSRPRTLLDLAGNSASFSVDDLVVIGDHLVRVPRRRFENRTEPFATIEELQQLSARHAGRGARRLRRALELVVIGSDSPAETRLRLAILRAGLPAPQVNVRIFDGTSDLGQPDLSWPEWMVCIEHEGPHHRTPQQQEKDIERGERRRDHGWIELQTTARDLRDTAARGVRRAEEKLRQHGWPDAARLGVDHSGELPTEESRRR